MKKPVVFLLYVLFALAAFAQKSNEQMGGVYYAYQVPQTDMFAAAPTGYTAFYISHYGRHGSRWLPHDNRYEWVLAQFADERNLTKTGKSVRKRMLKVWENARGNGGRLTSLGAKQQRGIAARMLQHFPALLKSGSADARSSVVGRCRKSMEAFVNEWKNSAPMLNVSTFTDSADMKWMSYDSPDLLLLQKETGNVPLRVSPDRFVANLFRDPSQVEHPAKLLTELHTIASDMQDIEGLNVSLFDIFTHEEIEAVYEQNCERMHLQNGIDARNHGVPAQCAANLWQNIVDEADEAIANGTPKADLRFGHDTALYRLLSLLNASSPFGKALDEIVPMAANLQMIFYRRTNEDVIVSFYLNEKPIRLSGLSAVLQEQGVAYYAWLQLKAAYAHYLATRQWQDHVRSINTIVGTDYAVTMAAGRYGKGSEEHGQTIPAVLEPHGMNFWTPQTQDTELKCIAPYYYKDEKLQGFRNSHWLVGGCTQDYGSFTLMPLMGELRLKPGVRASRFSHDDEVSHPYYYSVTLPDEHLQAEMTGRSRSAIFRFTACQDGTMHIVVNPNSDEKEGFVAVDTVRNCIWGYNPVHRIYQGWGEPAGFSGWYVVQFERPIKKFGVKDTVAYVTFDVRTGEQVLAKAASSFTDLDGAWRNLNAEIPAWNFLGTCLSLDSIWQKRLQTIEVSSADKAKENQFYGALYRASFLPHVISDVDGRYPKFGQTASSTGHSPSTLISSARKYPFYGDFSMWDIYRAQLPLLNIIAPRLTDGMMQSLADMYVEGGWMPIFPCWNSYTAAMIGDHAASALTDAYVKGNRSFDYEKAYEGLRKNAFESPKTFEEYKNGMGRRALKSYLKYGYIPMEDSVLEAFHTHEQVSRTLEYAYDDYCLAQLAKALGKTTDYQKLVKRAGNWRNAINPNMGWADGRHQNGKWLGNRDLTDRVPFITEGAVIHYSFYVPHDVYGLIEAMGGRSSFISKLNILFGIGAPSPTGEGRGEKPGEGFYWHGNEPCHQIPYMYAWAGQPWKTQQLVHHILKTEYLDVPGGLSGNDDAGQMSAWYIFSMLGFYPVCPAAPYYIIGTPAFEYARVGNLVIEAEGVSDGNIYIQSATWNGQPYTKTHISHDMITRGGTLRFVMGARPNTVWGSEKDDCPPNVM